MPETARAALLRADPLPRCPKFTQGAELHFFKQQLPTQQNKMLQPLQSVSWMGLCPAIFFCCFAACQLQRFGILALASAGLPSGSVFPPVSLMELSGSRNDMVAGRGAVVWVFFVVVF